MAAVKLRTEKVTGVTDLLQVSRPSNPARKPPSGPLKQHAGVPSLTGASRSLPQVQTTTDLSSASYMHVGTILPNLVPLTHSPSTAFDLLG